MQVKPASTHSGDATPRLKASAGSVVPGGYTRVSVILSLVPLLESFGVESADMLRDSGLPVDQLNDPENLIPFYEGSRFLGLCADRTACDHIGLMMGQQTSLESLGIIADLALAAPDVRSALRLIVRYLTLSDGGGLAVLSESAQFAQWGYAFYDPGIEYPELAYDHVLAFLCSIMRTLCGGSWNPHEVVFSRSPPFELQPYRNFFNAPLRFDADHATLVFKREWLNMPLATSDPAGLLALETQVRDIEARGTGDLRAQVRRIVRRQLLSGSTSMHGVAEELAIHRRTLDRRLVAQQISFRRLIADVRFEVARQLLRTHLSIASIAQSLQYSNSPAFTRAFRRWSGITPLQWRESLAARDKGQTQLNRSRDQQAPIADQKKDWSN